MLGSHGYVGKSTLYEEAIRVPLIINLPTKIVGGQVIHSPISLLDIAPTVLDFALKDTKVFAMNFQGKSLRAYMNNNAGTSSHDECEACPNLMICFV